MAKSVEEKMKDADMIRKEAEPLLVSLATVMSKAHNHGVGMSFSIPVDPEKPGHFVPSLKLLIEV